MAGKVLYVLVLIFARVKANKINVSERRGPLNMTFVVNTLNQVVSSCDSPVQSLVEALKNVTELLGIMMQKHEQLQSDVTFIKKGISKAVCGDGARYYSEGPGHCGSCYTTDVTLRTWNEARNQCRRQGSDLVSIETAGENNFLRAMMNNYSSILSVEYKKERWFGFWTSGSDEDEEGSWIWNATGSSFTFVNWERGGKNPDNYQGRQHHMSIMVNQGLWDDEMESKKMFSFCEKVLPC